MSIFEKTVSAIVYSIVYDRRGRVVPYANPAVRFVLRQHSRMPGFLRAGITAATILFELRTVVSERSFFHNLAPEKRLNVIRKLKKDSAMVFTELLRFYESLVTVHCYCDLPRPRVPQPGPAKPADRRVVEIRDSRKSEVLVYEKS